MTTPWKVEAQTLLSEYSKVNDLVENIQQRLAFKFILMGLSVYHLPMITALTAGATYSSHLSFALLTQMWIFLSLAPDF